MPYQPFYWIHVISYLIWVIAFVLSVYYYLKMRNSKLDIKLQLMKSERQISSLGAHLAVLGILLSGGAMVSIPSGPGLGWFPFEEHAWLAWKQVNFFVILILIAVSMPVSIRFKKTWQNKVELDNESEQLYYKAFTLTMAIYILVLVNTYLGLLKPSL